MVNLTEEEKAAIAKDIEDSKKRLSDKEKATDAALTKAKEDAKKEIMAEIEAKQRADAEAKEKSDMAKQIEDLKKAQLEKEEEYKRKLDAAISSQAVVNNNNPFAGSQNKPKDSTNPATYSESQLDDIERASRLAFDEYIKSKQ